MSNAAASPPEGAEAPRSRALERRLRRRRQEARLRLRLVADSSLLSLHHASRAPAVSAAPASSQPSHGWQREAEELRALLAVVRVELDALLVLADDRIVRELAVTGTATAPASVVYVETGDAGDEMGVEDPVTEPVAATPPRCAACSGTGKWLFGQHCGKCSGSGLATPTVAGSNSVGRDLAGRVRRLQKERPAARARWVTYCGETHGGVKDPLMHTMASLRRFLLMV